MPQTHRACSDDKLVLLGELVSMTSAQPHARVAATAQLLEKDDTGKVHMFAEARSMLLLPRHEDVSCDIDNSCVAGNHACVADSFNIVVLSLSQTWVNLTSHALQQGEVKQ